jgi:hypothetical protein
MFSKILIIAALAVAGAAEPATQPFAIQCTGTARFTSDVSGERRTRNYDVPRQVYVIDEARQRVQRAMEPRQEFEDVCGRGAIVDSRDFSPGLINVRTESAGAMCDFSVNRVTGEAEFFSVQELPGGRFGEMEWNMTCSPTEIPLFDRSRNRF